VDTGSRAARLTEVLRSRAGSPAPSWGEDFCLQLQATMEADLVSLNGLNPDLSLAWAVDSPPGTCHGDVAEALARLSSTHPVVRWGARHIGTPARLADIQPWSSFRRSALFADIYRPLGLKHELELVVPGPEGPVAVAVQRTGTDFHDRAADLLVLLRPVLTFASSMMWTAFEAQRRPGPTKAEPEPASGSSLLTPRECQILNLLALGARDAEVARQCGISPATAKKHVEHILIKLDVRTRAAAVAAGFRHHLISPS